MQNTNKYDLIKFEDGEFSLDVNVSPLEDTVWLTANQMALLFGRDEKTIRKHINNVFQEQEVEKNSNTHFLRVAGVDQKVAFYSLNVLISVGYRVKSKRGVTFRIWATSILKQYMLNGYAVNEKRCLECQENLVSLNNKVDYLLNETHSTLQRLNSLEHLNTLLSDKLFYEGDIFDAYSYIKQLFISAKSSITIIDGYVDLSVLDMLVGISIPITIYTYPSSTLTNQDIDKFNIQHNLTVLRTSRIHDRFIIIDDTIYLCGSSIKD
ncbi:MAG: virulence RhuM family protein, partial [Anaeroplasmataceae bacterium]|nr:virulence RhuM family protein [Anaeroplasmataceae bacterium]